MYFSFDKKLGHELCIWDKICNKLSCYNWVWIPKKSQVNKNQVFESARSSRNFIFLKFSFHFLFFLIRTLAGRRKAPQQGGEMGCVQGKWKLFCLFICLLFQVRQHFFACLIISFSGKSILTDEDIDFIARNTAMKREAVEIQYKTFLQKHPDGRISRKSFHMMMKECYPGRRVLGIRPGVQIVWWLSSLLTDWFQGRTQRSWSGTYSECTTPIRWVGPCLGVVFFEILWEIFRSEIPIPTIFLMLDSNKAGGTL